MKILEIQDIDELKHYAGDWSNLLNGSSTSSTLFTSPEWVLNWWSAYGDGKKLSVLMAYKGDTLMGVAPLYRSRNPASGHAFQTVRLLGSGVSDHLDFYIKPDRFTEIIAHLLDHLVTQLSWDILDFIDIPDDSPSLALMTDRFKRHNISCAMVPTIPCPYLPINGMKWDEFYAATRSKSTRQDLRRRERRLGELGSLAFRRYTSPQELQDIFPQLFELYDKRWEGKNISLGFTGERERRFYPGMAADLAAKQRLHILTLELDHKVLAFTLSAHEGSQFTWLITAHDPSFEKYFPGELVLVELIKDVFSMGGFSEFDFTRGEEPYKYKWTSQQRHSVRLVAARRSLLNWIPYYATIWYSIGRREAKKSKLLKKLKLETLGKIKGIFT